MGSGDIDAAVKSFIHDKIESVEHLEILLLLHAQAERTWSAEEVVASLRNELESARIRLADLAQKRLLAVDLQGQTGTASPRYRYAPVGPLAAAVDKLAATYSMRRVTVIQLIFSKPLDRIQVFADAFKLRKD